MRLYRSEDGKRPQRLRKSSYSFYNSCEPYQQILVKLRNGGLQSGEELGIVLTEEDLIQLRGKHPARSMTANIRRLIQGLNLIDHRVSSYRTKDGWLVYISTLARKPRPKSGFDKALETLDAHDEWVKTKEAPKPEGAKIDREKL